MIPGRKALLIALLILTTALWGAAVSGHSHVEPEPDLCEICLLPHLGDIGAATQLATPIPPASVAVSTSHSRPDTVTRPCYRSRAPPA